MGQCDAFAAGLASYGEVLTEEGLFGCNAQTYTLEDFSKSITVALENIRYLITWGDYRRAFERANTIGLDSIIEAIDSERITPEESAALFRHSVYDSMAREIISKHSQLAAFTRAEFEGIRERFSSAVFGRYF